ncbi:MAG: ADOP family duplicated permease [Acidobacteriota bacterium]
MLRWTSRRSVLQQEMEGHIAAEIQENIDKGMSPEEARHAAMKTFGNQLLALEHSREAWGWVRLERLLQDLRYSLRTLRKAPGYTVMVVLTLALGLGAVATMLAIVNSVLLRPITLPHSEQLVNLNAEHQQSGSYASAFALSYKQIDALRRDSRSFSGVSGYNTLARPVAAADGTRIAMLVEVTPDLFSTLGVKTDLGRLITSADAHAPVVVVNNAFWRERLHSDPKAIGSAIKVSDKTRTVIGVLPAALRFPQNVGDAAVYVPVVLNAKGEDDYLLDSAAAIGRLKPGFSQAQALTDTQGVIDHTTPATGSDRVLLKIRSYQETITGDMRKPLLVLLGGVGVLLLIAFANAANLQIGRAASRIEEMQIRSALGAGFARLLQQLIAESVIVSLAGAALGSAVAVGAVALIRHSYGDQYARFNELAVQPVVLIAIALLAVAAGVAASIAPMARIRHELRVGKSTRGATRAARLPGILVALQVALTCVLLVTCGLFVRTFLSLENVDLGFDPHGVTTLVLMPLDQHQDPQLSREIETRLLHRFETLPGIQSVTMQTSIPFSSYNMALDGTTDVEGRTFQKGDSAMYTLVSTTFVPTSGIRLLQGRGFQPQDETGPMVVLVNQAFVHKFLPGRDPIGAGLHFHPDPGDPQTEPLLHPMRIVGVVQNEMQGGNLGEQYRPMVYLDYAALPKESMLSMVFTMSAQYAVRSKLPAGTVAAELRSTVKQEAPSMAEVSLKPMEQSIAESLNQRRLALQLVAGFGAVALFLSAIGLYGVLAYSVTLRRREIGVRLALGSSRGGVTTLVTRQAGAMLLWGLIPGLAAAWLAGRLVRSFLFGVQPLDVASMAWAGLVLLAVAAFAALAPALRAASVNPVEMLRVE